MLVLTLLLKRMPHRRQLMRSWSGLTAVSYNFNSRTPYHTFGRVTGDLPNNRTFSPYFGWWHFCGSHRPQTIYLHFLKHLGQAIPQRNPFTGLSSQFPIHIRHVLDLADGLLCAAHKKIVFLLSIAEDFVAARLSEPEFQQLHFCSRLKFFFILCSARIRQSFWHFYGNTSSYFTLSLPLSCFDHFDSNSHSGIRTFTKMVIDSIVWPGMRKGVLNWILCCYAPPHCYFSWENCPAWWSFSTHSSWSVWCSFSDQRFCALVYLCWSLAARCVHQRHFVRISAIGFYKKVSGFFWDACYLYVPSLQWVCFGIFSGRSVGSTTPIP